MTEHNLESCSATFMFSFTIGAIILTVTAFSVHFLICCLFFQYSMRPCEEVMIKISSLAEFMVLLYFFLAISEFPMMNVFCVGLSVSISVIFSWTSVELHHSSSKTAVNAFTRVLQSVQRHTSSFSIIDVSVRGLTKNTASSSSFMNI